MKLFKNILLIFTFLFSSLTLLSNQALADLVAGKDYKVIEPAQATSSGNKIEVLEFFFYGCSHCFQLHPNLTSWEKKKSKDVEIVSLPTVFNPNWEPMAYTYYALEAIGQKRNLHHDLFDAWNVNNIDLSDEAKISAFVSKLGVDSKKFSDAYHSFGVQSKVTRSKQLTQSYNIRGTPTLIVDGKYLITGLRPDDTITVLNLLIEKARAERAGKR